MNPGRSFYDPDAGQAFKPSAPDDVPMPVIKIVPSVPANQSDRPQIRPVIDQDG